MDLTRRSILEAIGTFWLVLGGCGTAVIATTDPLSVGTLGVSLAFGLTVLTMAYAIGSITGCHLNPAVTVGLIAAKRFPAKEAAGYIVAQVVGAIAAIGVIAVIMSGLDSFDFGSATFAANGYGDLSPAGFKLGAALVTEVVMTFMFLLVILFSTDERAPKGFAPISIGLCLTLIHLISIPVTNTSVNPARSIAPALFAGGDYIGQLWLFIVGPVVGAALAGLVYGGLFLDRPARR